MKELFEKYMNKKAYAFLGGLKVEVTITNIKQVWGKERFLITPISGSGAVWTECVSEIH